MASFFEERVSFFCVNVISVVCLSRFSSCLAVDCGDERKTPQTKTSVLSVLPSFLLTFD